MEPTTHPFDREEVMAYLDGELAPERAAAAAAHLEQCAECRELTASLRTLSRQLPQWEVGMIPATVEQNVLRATMLQKVEALRMPREERPAPSRRPVRWLAWGSAIAVAALFLIAVSVPNMLKSREATSRTDQQATGLPAPVSVMAPTPTRRDELAARQSTDLNQFSGYQAAGNAAAAKAKAPVAPKPSEQQGPMIIRRASLALLTKEFDAARAALENLVKAHQGYFGQLNVAAPAAAGRSLSATVRVPASQLDPVLVELRKLGKVEQENQSADDVTRQYVDLTARLANARETEKRLVEILRERTGKVSDVLEVEEQIAATREQIEQMDAERKTLDSQVQYASIDLRITEEYKQSLETPTPSVGTRLNNAMVGGLRDAADLLIGLVLWLLGAVPTLAVLAAMLAWPVLKLVRWVRRRLAATPVAAAD